MKVSLFILLLSFTIPVLSQPVNLPADSIKQLTVSIRKEYNRINTLTSLSCTQEDIEGESLEGAVLRKCYNGKQLIKANFIWLGETFKASGDFYCKDGKVIFFYIIREQYNHSIDDTTTKLKVQSTTKNRYYFNNSKLIYWLKGNQPQRLTSYKQQEQDILAIVKKHLQ